MIPTPSKPDVKKMYHSISEVAKMTGLEQHVLRYWESEFSKLRPKKNRAGNRQFRDKDIQIIRYIKHLLYNDMYTVQGAKKKLSESGYQEVQGQINLLAEISAVTDSPAIQSNDNVEPLEIKPSEAQEKFEESQKIIETLNQQIRELKKSPVVEVPVTNDSEVDALKEQVHSLTEQLSELKQSIAATPTASADSEEMQKLSDTITLKNKVILVLKNELLEIRTLLMQEQG